MSFTTYKSSAGSGKTTTLVAEYLTIALNSQQADNYRKILAITFTNKAAHEMKQRVINSLKSMANDSPEFQKYPVIYNKVKESLHLNNEQLKRRASNTLNHILHHYNDFSISTIDSFTHKIIRTFAHDLKLPVNFEVDLDNDALLKKSIDLLLSRIGENEALTATLVDFSTSKTENSKSWRIGNDLAEFAKLLIKDEYENHLDALRQLHLDDFKAARKAIQKSIKVKEKRWFERAVHFMDVLAHEGLDYLSLAYNKTGPGSYFNKLFNKNFEYLDPSKRLLGAIEKNKWHSGNASKDVQLRIQSIQDKLTAIGSEMVADVYDYKTEYVLEIELNKYIYQLAVLREIELEMQQYKADNNIMSISEFNTRIAEIVLNEPAPFIYERLGERYQHYLIDEFQDTSESQWKNLLPLLSNSLSQGSEGKVNFNMVVGDAKQSIYRWRGGDADQFMELPGIKGAESNLVLAEHQQILARNHQEKVLDSNYRSKREIVEFNNWLFQEMVFKANSKYIQNVYWGKGNPKEQTEEFRQKFREDHTGGYISFEIKEYEEKEEFEDHNLQRILTIIHESLSDGYRAKDICLLFRTNDKAILTANYLVNNNINVLSSETLLIKNDPAVHAIMAFLKWTADPEDRLNSAGLLTSLHRLEHFSFRLHEKLRELAREKSNKKKFIEDFLKDFHLDGVLSKVQTYSIYESVQLLSSLLKLDQQPNAYLSAFAQQAHSFSTRKSNHLKDFLEFWEQKSDGLSISIPEGSDAVRIMTIHKSKGLEFPVVIVPFIDWDYKKSNQAKTWVKVSKEKYHLEAGLISLSKDRFKETKWQALALEEMDKSKLDYYNILYVAVTRPVDRLYGIVSKRKRESNTISKLMVSLLEEHPNWNSKENILTVGARTQVSTQEASVSDNSLSLKPRSNSNWREQLQLAVSTPWNQQESAKEARAFGEILHYLLSLEGSIEKQFDEMNQLVKSGWIDVSFVDSIKEKLLAIETYQPYQELKEKALYKWSERELAHPDHGIVRPDKVLFFNEETVVIDFKTGSYRKKHEEQLSIYVSIIRELQYPGPRGVLFYLDDLKWVEL